MATSNITIQQYDQSNLIIFGLITNPQAATYTNSTGSTATIATGRLLGRIATTGLIVPQNSAATDGSQVPIGICIADYSVPDTESVTITFAVQCQVDYSKIGFQSGDSLTTVISLTDSATNTVKIGTINDILVRSGILPLNVAQNSYYDNL